MIVLGAITLVNDTKSKRNLAFFLFTVCVAVWIMACYVSNDVNNSATVSLYGNYTVFLFSYLSSLLLLYLVIDITEDRRALRWLSHLLVPLVGVAMISVTPLVVGGVAIQHQVYAVDFGPLIVLYAAALLSMLVGAVILLGIHARRKTGILGKQVTLLFHSMVVAVPILILTQFIVPAVTGSFWITDIGLMAIVIPVAGLYYGALRHRLFDIRLAAVRTIAYVMSIATMAGVYFGLAYVASVTVFRGNVTTGLSMSPINIVLALILAFIFQPIKQFFDHITNQIFYRDRYDTNEFITRLGRELTSTTHLHDVLEKAGKEIETTLKARGSMFLIFRDSHPDTVVSSRLKNHFNDNEYSMLRGLATVYGGSILEVESLGHLRTHAAQQLHAVFAKRNIALVLPLIGGDETIGYLLLGEQMGSGYAKRDIQALETIADELVIAIQNARSVHEVRELNAHLEQRIKTATEDLQVSNARLVKLDATKDEFVSMASHQLRTPLTSVKGYISMVIEGDAGKITRAQRQLLEEAFTSSERMVHLIGDFLNVSRLQTGKFMIDFSAVDLAQVVAQEVEGIRQIAQTHGMTIIYTQPARFPLLYVDENKLRQVIMNFIDNAIYYSPDSREPITVKLAIEEGDAVLRIIDKGMGVPKDAQQQLFGKFFRAENARKQRPDGTGIGLFLAKKIIDGHGGKLVFESIEGEGSTFGFRLPIKKLSTQPSEIADDHTPPKTTQL